MQFLFILFLTFFSACYTYAANLDDWRTRSIYQVVTDRFATTMDSSPNACETGARKYCGGTWRGIARHLDYIQNMGFDAVWISPVVSNIEGETYYGEAYHGYWARDINALNEHFGSADDLKNLSEALHSRGMYLMVDIVVNHMGPNTSASTFSTNDSFSAYKPFSQISSYHPFRLITPSSYSPETANKTDIEQSWLGDGVAPLPDINTEDTNVVRTLKDWVRKLVSDYGIDGLRIDTAKHVRQDFWPDFKSSAGVFTIGEVLHDDVNYVAPYTRVLDGVLDYPTYFPLFSAFTAEAGKEGNLTAIASAVLASQSAYQHGTLTIGSFVENHDQPRIMSKTKDLSLVLNAMTWPFVNDGIPILYYGQEQGFSGAEDPDNREALWKSGYQTDTPLVKHVTSLNALRKAAISAKQNFLTTPMTFIPQPNQSTTTLVASKPPLIALLTNAGSATPVTWTIPKNTFRAADRIIDGLTCKSVDVATTNSEGDLVVASRGGMPQILLSAAVLQDQAGNGRLCQDVGSTNNGSIRRARYFLVLLSNLWLAMLLQVF